MAGQRHMLLMSRLTVPASPLIRLARQAAFRLGLPTRRSTTFRRRYANAPST
jgi:hypothetical protein